MERGDEMHDTAGWDWRISKDVNGSYSWDAAKVSLLMDIRREIQSLRRIFACNNFLTVPFKLDRIVENTHRKVARKKTARKKKHKR